MAQYVFVVGGRTESGDEVGPYVWLNEPNKETIIRTLREHWQDEFETFGEDGGISWYITSERLRT